jgi:drug/metabolite transporter (DMT)-like permease
MIIGELAALGSVISGTATITLFTYISDRVGVYIQTLWRLLFGLVVVGVAQYFLAGSLFEHYETTAQVWYFVISGLIGFTIGDLFLFRSSILLGPRLGILVFITYVPMATLLAVPLLGERMGFMDIIGMVITLAGVVMVVLSGRNGAREGEFVPQKLLLGVLLGLMGALCNALGLVLAKMGMVDSSVSVMNVLFIRILAAASASWLFGLFAGYVRKTVKGPPSARLLGLTAIGAVTGPLLSVWLSLVAMRYTYTGIATTIMSIAPIVAIPMARITHHERITPQIIIGTVIAVAGVAVLFLW